MQGANGKDTVSPTDFCFIPTFLQASFPLGISNLEIYYLLSKSSNCKYLKLASACQNQKVATTQVEILSKKWCKNVRFLVVNGFSSRKRWKKIHHYHSITAGGEI